MTINGEVLQVISIILGLLGSLSGVIGFFKMTDKDIEDQTATVCGSNSKLASSLKESKKYGKLGFYMIFASYVIQLFMILFNI